MGLIESRNIIWVALAISSPNKNPTHQGFSLADHCESVVDRTTGLHLKRGRWFTNSPHQFRKPKECPKYGKHATKLSKEPSNSKTVFRKCFFPINFRLVHRLYLRRGTRVWCHHSHVLRTSPTGAWRLGPPTAYSSPVARRLHTSECTACWGAETKWYILSAKTRFRKMMHATSCNSSNVLILNSLTWWHVLFCIGIYVELTWEQVESYMPHLANIWGNGSWKILGKSWQPQKTQSGTKGCHHLGCNSSIDAKCLRQHQRPLRPALVPPVEL